MDIVATLARLLRERRWWLATAESCTGGGIAVALTEYPGASEFFKGAAVVYANDWKHRLLGVREETLLRAGAVSAETATQMLDGLSQRFGVEAGIAVTGIAGPGGGTADKPVGLVFIGTAIKGARHVERYVFSGDRRSVRQQTVNAALIQLKEDLLNECG